MNDDDDFSPLEVELLDKLTGIKDDEGMLLYCLDVMETDEERRAFIEAIDNGEIKTEGDALRFACLIEQSHPDWDDGSGEAGLTAPDEIVEWAKVHGFDGAETTGKQWNGYNVYEPVYEPDEDGNYPCVGLPEFILVKDGEIRTTRTEKEIWDVYHLLYPPTEDDEEEDDEE